MCLGFVGVLACETQEPAAPLEFAESEVIVRSGPCEADCVGRVCGPDGCGGSCGWCPTGEQCGLEGACEPQPEREPAPSCSGRECFAACGVWDIPCAEGCMQDLGLTEEDEAVQALACVQAPCPSCDLVERPEDVEFCHMTCLLDQCVSEFPTCLAGEGGCWGLANCVKECKVEFESQRFYAAFLCEVGGWIDSTIDAQWNYIDLHQCIEDACEDDAGTECAIQLLQRAIHQLEGPCVAQVDGCQKN